MSSIILVTGRVTADPVIQQGRTTGTEYINLGLATNQRGADGNDEAVFYQCYCNKFLADRLGKAGVKKGTCLLVYGELELRPFLYQKGERAGQPGLDAHITVKTGSSYQRTALMEMQWQALQILPPELLHHLQHRVRVLHILVDLPWE